MPIFAYKAYGTTGKVTKGNLDAESITAAKKKLKDNGLFVTELQPLVVRQKATKSLSQFINREKTQQLASITRQLATLLSAGLPLLRAFTAIIEQLEPGELKDTLTTIRDAIREGDSFAAALRKFPAYFPTLMVNMVEAGESGGALEITLTRLADFYEGRVALRNRIRATLAYPVFMLIVGASVLFFLFVFLIPRVTTIFDQMDTALPLPTQVLIYLSQFIQNFWWFFLMLIILAIFGVRYLMKNEQVMKKFDRSILKIPIVGTILLKLAVARFARTLGTMLQGGVSLFQALGIVKTIINNRFLEDIVEEVRVNIGEGGSLTALLREKKIFPPVFLHMTGVGEETGELENMMIRVADTYETEVDQAITAATSLLEPIMILFMGVVVGIVVMAILLPIFEMSNIIK